MHIDTGNCLSSHVKAKPFARAMHKAKGKLRAQLTAKRLDFYLKNPKAAQNQYGVGDTINVPMHGGSWEWVPTNQFAAEQDVDCCLTEYDFTLAMNSKAHFFLPKAIDVIQNIRVANPALILSRMVPEDLDSEEGYAFNFGSNRLLKCSILLGMLTIINVSRTTSASEPEVRISACSICDMQDCGWDYAKWRDANKAGRYLSVHDESLFLDFIKGIIFLQYTEPELVFLSPKSKASKSGVNYINNSTNDITIVDSTWNKYIIRTEGFGVTGHFRLQPHGEKSQLRKLIWVQPFQKHGYVRRPKAETNSITN